MFDSLISFASGGLTQVGLLGMFVYILIVTQLTIFTVTLYLHRSQAHRGVDFQPLLAHFFRFWAWLTTGIITKEWVAVHRKHHARVETTGDPHSPMVYGIHKVLWQGAELYRLAAKNPETTQKYGRGTPTDWLEQHLYTPHALLGTSLMLAINMALFGVAGVAVWAIQMLWIPFWAAGVVNGIGHYWGYRNFESADTSRNLVPWGLWIGGEELHNNHHAFPSSAKFALRRAELDIGWLLIQGLSRCHLAKILRVAPGLNERANVNLPDAETLRAVLTHRFQALTEYYRKVVLPILGDEVRNAGDQLRSLPVRLRRALANGGRWLDQDGRDRLRAAMEQHPSLRTVIEYRQRFVALLEQRSPEQALKALQEWVHDAECSGITTLQQFAQRIKGYAIYTV